ncbi:ANTAR domain-containing protein [Aquipuribacter nitratireducens]|uniref:ANTAR domain-containing protein n=1 Tax=Aquipuribacter nitratireducens TaxID=650104 RepID=A0ABW0GL52_9MICO
MPRPAERPDHRRLLELARADDDGAVRLLVEDLDREVALEELRTALEEISEQHDHVLALSQDLAERRRWVERMTAGLPLPVVVTDAGGLVVEANARMSTLLVVPLHRLLGKPLVSFVAPDDRARLAGSWHRLVADGDRHSIALRLLGRDERETPVVLVGLPDTHERTRWFAFADQDAPSATGRTLDLAHVVSEIMQLPQAYGTDHTRALLHSAVSFVTPLLPAAAGASLALGPPERPLLQASDSAFAQRVDGLEVMLEEGPCVDAFRGEDLVVSEDVPRDARWPRLADRAREVGLASVVAAPVQVADRTVGVLNVYGARDTEGEDGLADERDIAVVRLMAASLGGLVAVVHERTELVETRTQLEAALRSRPVIDQAKGILMLTYGCTPDEAFDRLVAASRHRNVKLRHLAERVVADPASAADEL